MFVTACGSGGTTSSGDQLDDNDSSPITDPDTLPISGTVHYSGFLSLGLPTSSGRTDFTGNLGLTVAFDAVTGQVTGEADQFRAPDAELLRGRILITDGQIDRATNTVEDYTFDAQLSGTLSGDDFRNMVITGAMVGDFNGENADVVSGQVFGDVVGPAGLDIYNGTFSATQ